MTGDRYDSLLENLAEVRWNTKEASRLFHEIHGAQENLGYDRMVAINDNSDRASTAWVQVHLSRAISAVELVEVEIIECQTLRFALEEITNENVALKRRFLEEKRRTASLYHSINDLIVLKMAQEKHIDDLKLKLRSVRIETNKLKREKDDMKKKTKSHVETKDFKEDKTSGSKRPRLSLDEGNSSLTKQSAVLSTNGAAQHVNGVVGAEAATVGKSTCESSKPDDRLALVGRKIKKRFKGHGYFVGVVEKYAHPFYFIRYPEDGDSEDMTVEDVVKRLIPIDEPVKRDTNCES